MSKLKAMRTLIRKQIMQNGAKATALLLAFVMMLSPSLTALAVDSTEVSVYATEATESLAEPTAETSSASETPSEAPAPTEPPTQAPYTQEPVLSATEAEVSLEKPDSELASLGAGAIVQSGSAGSGTGAYTWTLDEEGVLTLTGTENGKARVAACPVDKSLVKKLVIDRGIASFGNSAFKDCANLEEIDATGASELYQFSGSTFMNCTKLKTADFSDCVKLTWLGDESGYTGGADRAQVFMGCTSLEYVSFSGCTSLKMLKGNSFSGCESLTDIDLTGCSGLVTICGNAFYNCKSLQSIDFADCGNLTTVVDHAFENTALTSIDFRGTNLTELQREVFKNCKSLLTADFSGTPLTKTNDNYGSNQFSGCSSLVSVSFANCTNLTELHSMFGGCNSLEEVDLSGCIGIETIYGSVFDSKPKLKKISMEDCVHLKRLEGKEIFRNCKAPIDLTLYPELEIICNTCFSGAENVTVDFTKLPNLREIGSSAFNSVKGITTADFSQCKKLEKIGDFAFEWGRELTTVNLSGAGTESENGFTIGKSAFGHNNYGDHAARKLETVDLSNSKVTSIGDHAFHFCSSLSNVNFSGCLDLETIGSSAFDGCTNLYEANLKYCTSLTTIGAKAFNNCRSLEELVIPDNVTSISSDSFLNCDGIQMLEWRATDYTAHLDKDTFSSCGNYELHISENVNTLPNGFFRAVKQAGDVYFDTKPGGHVITVSSDQVTADGAPLFETISHDIFVDEQGVVYELMDDGTARAVYAPPGIVDYTVPATISAKGATYTVTEIAPSSFTKARDLTTLRFEDPANIKKIGENAFYGLNSLSEVIDVIGSRTAKTIQQAKNLFNHIQGGSSVPDSAFKRCALTDDTTRIWNSGFEKPELYIHNDTDQVTVGRPTSSNSSLEGTTYHYMTGNHFNVPVKIQTSSNTGCVVQIFIDASNSGYHGFSNEVLLSTQSGEVIARGTPRQTNDPDIKCLEFVLNGGATASCNLDLYYPTPSSAGGDIRLWVNIPEHASSEDEAIIAVMNTPAADGAADYMHAEWMTERRERNPRKVAFSSRVAIRGSGDSNDSDTFYVNGSSWRIFLDYASDKKNANVGQDFATSASYTDVLRLPKGIVWNDKILSAIRTGNYTFKNIKQSTNRRQCYLTVDGEQVMYLEFPGNTAARRINFTVDENDDLLVTWDLKNPSTTTDLTPDSIIFGVLDDALLMKLSEVEVTDPITGDSRPAVEQDFPLEFDILNEVDVRVSYTHSSLSEPEPSVAHMKAVADKANLVLNKQHLGADKEYLGDDTAFLITAKNIGAQSTNGLNYIEDVLADGVIKLYYLSPENMERMFSETYGDRLTVTINDASLYRWSSGGSSAYSTNDGTVELNRFNSGSMQKTASEQTITIVKADNGNYRVTCGAETAEGASVRELLDTLGYFVDGDCVYTVRWDFTTDESHPFPMIGGSVVELPIYATYKDTFALLTSDWPSHYKSPASWSQEMDNRAQMHYTEVNDAHETVQKLQQASAKGFTVYPEISIGKRLNTAVQDGNYQNDQMIYYTVSVSESGNRGKTDLPVTDKTHGTQMLVVRADKNPELADRGLEEKHYYGTTYYLLSQGEYHHICFGADKTGKDIIADTVTVSRYLNNKIGAFGYDSTVYWYLESLDGGEIQTITYPTLIRAVDSTGAVAKSYAFDNKAFVNDKKDHRLYSTVGGGGSTYGLSKKIVLEHGDEQHDGETFDEDDFTMLTAKQRKVTYKIALTYDPKDPTWSVSFSGNDLYDRLPQTFGCFEWTRGDDSDAEGNVSLEVVCKGGAKLYPGFEDDWYISDDGDYGSASGQYYIRWRSSDENAITLTGKSELDLYVTLTYEDSESWSTYADAAEGRTINNLFSIDGNESREAIVYHDIRDRNKAYLQKGVNNIYQIGLTDSRKEYGNIYSYVEYYTALYNGGNSRLYLSDLIDTLPRGFSFHRIDNRSGAYTTGIGTAYETVTLNEDIEKNKRVYPALITDANRTVKYVSLKVCAQPMDGNKVRFYFDGKREASDLPNYDRDYELFYLSPGEAIVFSYLVDVDENATNTDSTAINRVVMEFNDPLGLGVDMYDLAPGGAIHGVDRSGVAYNDGGCMRYGGYSGLQSTVTLTRGEPVPGVTKRVVSYTDANGVHPINNGENAPSAQNIAWRVTVRDAGYNDIRGYRITDTMQYPYRFTGDVYYKVYDQTDASAYRVYESAGTFERPLFSVIGYREVSPDEAYAIIEDILGERHTVRIGMDEAQETQYEETLTIPYLKEDYGNIHNVYQSTEKEPITFRVSFGYDSDRNARMSVIFPEETMPLLPYCYGVLQLETETNIDISNLDLYNSVVFEPDNKEYKTIDEGKHLYDGEGNNIGVYAEANISLVSGGGTTCEKRVSENAHPENCASSNDDNNTITLRDQVNTFTYELSVTNSTGSKLDKLIIADHLPAINDMFSLRHNVHRGSEFKVYFDETLGLKVTIHSNQNGDTPIEVDRDHYKVQFSDKILFDNDDLTEASAAGWTDICDPSVHRSIRFILDDDLLNETIHNDDTVTVSFSAISDQEPIDQGKIAYNGFAYWYKSGDLMMHASSRLVGVQVPTFPRLQKKTVNLFDLETPVSEEKEFYFIVYEGHRQTLPEHPIQLSGGVPVKDAQGNPILTAETKALFENASPPLHYSAVTIKLLPGESLTAPKSLYQHEMWQDDTEYTIEEMMNGNAYENREWVLNDDSGERSFTDNYLTFRYDSSSIQTLVGVNTYMLWDFKIVKTSDFSHNRLPGAVFALYSPDSSDVIRDGTFEDDCYVYDDETKIPLRITHERTTWYLTGVKETVKTNVPETNGVIRWNELTREQYLYTEVKAPNGYFLPTDGYKIVLNTDLDDVYGSVATKEIENHYGYLIPGSGGFGVTGFIAAGVCLTSLSVIGMSINFVRKRRRKRISLN